MTTYPGSGPTEARYQGLADASLALHSVRDHDELLVSATRVTTQMLDAEGSSVVLRDPATGDLVFHVVTGAKASELSRFRLGEGEGITGLCVQTASTLVVNDARGDPRFSPRADAASGFTTRNILCAPLVVAGECIGALSVVNCRSGAGFSERDRVFCEVMAAQIAVALRNVQLTQLAVEAERLAAIGQAVAGVAHCMKNVLCVLQGGYRLAVRELGGREGATPSPGLDLVGRNLGRLSDLVQNMLLYAKDGTPDVRPLDLGILTESVVESLRPGAEERGVRLDVEASPRLEPIEADESGIYRCLLNLVSNAIDACSGDGDRVRVTAGPAEPGWVSIEVADRGCGMDEETRASAFVPFFSTKGSAGTGLGLAVTRKIVQEHGGCIDVESREGIGSTFRVLLPSRRPGGTRP